MVSLSQVQQSNSSTHPPRLVAVFAGATAGIGEAALKAFTRSTVQPRIYFIGRSKEAGDRLEDELKTLNPGGEYTFIQADMSLLKNVDEVCGDIKKREKTLNVLFLSQGTLKYGVDTSEGLPLITGLSLYSRTRLTLNLLPLLRRASSLRRVITVMAGTKEGRLSADDIPGRTIAFRSARGHLCTALTLSLEALALRAPEVSFVHSFPGAVDTDLIRRGDGLGMQLMKQVFRVKMTVMRGWVPREECGERQAWLCLSGRFPGREEDGDADAAVGVDGEKGSGVYSVDWDGESAGEEVVRLLGGYRGEGMVERVWGHLEDEFVRITGVACLKE
ncbi:hypothetical protein ACJ41O_008708 [Fusarium nematophilum]